MMADPYRDLYSLARESIRALAIKLHTEERVALIIFDNWLFSSAADVPFLRDRELLDSPNDFWRIAHRFLEWLPLSELALRLITCGTSEADAERILSMQRNVAGLHGTRFGLPSMEARLRELMARPSSSDLVRSSEMTTGVLDEDHETDDSDTE
jgi:hypothetical protein